MSADRDAMYAAFERHPGDAAGYGAMADELDALGYANLAHAFRWMMCRQKWPHKRDAYVLYSGARGRKVSKNHRWAWYADTVRSKCVSGVLPIGTYANHGLPWLLLPFKQKVFASHQEAVMWLAAQLATLRNVYVLELKPAGLPLIDVLKDEIRTPPLLKLDEEVA